MPRKRTHRTYRRILTSFWTDPDLRSREVGRELRYLLLYFFTNRHTHMSGLYHLPLAYASQEADVPVHELVDALRGPLRPYVSYDFETEEILVHRMAFHNIGETLLPRDNRIRSIERALADTASAELRTRWHDLYPGWKVEPADPEDVEGGKPLTESHTYAEKEGASLAKSGSDATKGRGKSKKRRTYAEKEAPSKPVAVAVAVTGAVAVAVTGDRAKQHPPPDGYSAAIGVTGGQDDEHLGPEIVAALPLAKANIVRIHGGTEAPIEIEGHTIGVGLEIEVFRELCRVGRDSPAIIAEAIAHLPDVTGLEPPISLARWGASDGTAIYEQCVGRAYASSELPAEVTAKRAPRGKSKAELDETRAGLRAQLDQLRQGGP